MSLIDRYQEYITIQNFQQDSLQLQAIEKLESIGNILNNVNQKNRWSLFRKKVQSVKGLYMWGGVGRGKTFIMDLFYESLILSSKRRQHFNHFMKEVHTLLKQFQGQKNPLYETAKDIAKQSKVICFDEFFVEDIADAMILGNLFKMLFSLDVTLVTTSNIPPERLYQGGLQRELFLPAINALTEHVEVFNLDSGVDYRQQILQSVQRYFYPLTQGTSTLTLLFKKQASSFAIYDTEIILEDRLVRVKAVDEQMIWFDFFAICGDTRGVNDYIALAKRFDYIFISEMPILTTKFESETRRFIAMIDEFYDEGKYVIISADRHFDDIYQGERLKFEFQRTKSRLQAMQSDDYFKR
ncbi:cell division protein ZapE [Fastidiosibacter lacustris]|uniref:cell division protein ZapE n=1 Tax=Fastidiosibacter lacustris TaxID=2056695 RepID=UPI000E355069|nr:cell division protein ZapE [Fastidiosibacter lacustris]